MKKTRKHSIIFSALLIAALVFSLAAPPCAEAYSRWIHAQIGQYAKMLANNNLDPLTQKTVPDWMEEINRYVPDMGPDDPYLYDIPMGAYNEDEIDHVWNHEGWCVSGTHFWDPDLGSDWPFISVFCNTPNAWQKARVLWGMALGQYHLGNKASAYEYLGHIVHLVGDLTVPAHAHSDSHVYPDEYDDNYSNGDGLDYSPPDLKDDEKRSVQESEMVKIPNPATIPNGDTVHPLYWLLYTTAQVGGHYPSDDYEGNSIDPWDIPGESEWDKNLLDFTKLDDVPEGVGPAEMDGCDYTDLDSPCTIALATIRSNSYFYSIRAVAALYKLFAETVKQQSELTVVIDSVKTIEKADLPYFPPPVIDPWDDPDYFARVWIGRTIPEDHNGAWFRNEGEQTDPVAVGTTSPLTILHGSNGWAFANDVGLTGIVSVQIELEDDDTTGYLGDYEHWDIYSGPNEEEDAVERHIWLTIDLDKCRAGASSPEPAITGDLTGMCGVQLTSTGDDNPRSEIKFRILPPNSPPEAHAGPDQTVNEGDLVTLNGTFTDPDTYDTHTYLWHLVSSTNVQGVPDSTTQTLSFVPCDNGVYTFTFTVKDNHGAEGSDTVVVTALNVPPVVSAPHISNQPNAEFILPVVHEIDFEGLFTDAGECDTHTAVWDWGDGKTSNGVVSELSGSGNITKSHTYALPGDYTITLTVTDDDGGSGSNTMTIHIADAGEALNIFNAYIQSLPASVFKNNANQRKNAFDNMFYALDNKLANQAYQGMIKSMNSNIRTKFDGLVGGSPKDDWIKQDLAIQKELCQKVDDITRYLQYLLSTMP